LPCNNFFSGISELSVRTCHDIQCMAMPESVCPRLSV
jgi:hypothetical protein